MVEALIPYIVAPEKTIKNIPIIDEFTLQIFGVLVATGVILGMRFCLRYAKAKDIDEFIVRDLMFWVLVVGFVVAHWVSVIFYFPDRVKENPWVLLMIWNGISSVGGFLGAFLGMVWYLRKMKQPILPYADVLSFGILIGFTLGRVGCSLVHDHPGLIVEADTFLAVGPWPCHCGPGERPLPSCCSEANEVYRYDLGLMELIFDVALCLFVYRFYNWRKATPGQMTGLVALGWGFARFWLDFLRETQSGRGVGTPDLRYFGLTTAQYLSIAIFLVGAWLLFVRKSKDSDSAWSKDSERIAKEKAADDKDDDGDKKDDAEKKDDGDDDDEAAPDDEEAKSD
jgi:phosphatidylglycerol:prolipoprotein diacylglycerol transferase